MAQAGGPWLSEDWSCFSALWFPDCSPLSSESERWGEEQCQRKLAISVGSSRSRSSEANLWKPRRSGHSRARRRHLQAFS